MDHPIIKNKKAVKQIDDYIYSRQFMIRAKSLEISKICPPEISSLKITFENQKLEQPVPKKSNRTWIRAPVKKREKQGWASKLEPDLKRMTLILNKLTSDTYDKYLEESKTFNYADPGVVSIIFRKTLAEPFYSELYAKFCKDLIGLHDLMRDLCLDEFTKNKHKNLAQFIGELYKLDLVDDLNIFIEVLLEDIGDNNLEILCKIIATIGPKNPIFKEILEHLDDIKGQFSNRYRFMILDVIENRTVIKKAN